MNFRPKATLSLIALNTVLFVITTIQSGSLFNPDIETMVLYGAKDPLLIAIGHWWRYITPVALHFGLIHFLFNNFALYSIGRFLEQILGRTWFLLIYIGAGIVGNIASHATNLTFGAGASGAIFGLLGVGLGLELVFYWHLKRSGSPVRPRLSFLSVVILNALLGFFIPNLDQAAHMGGLLFGFLFGVFKLWYGPGPFRRSMKKWAIVGMALVLSSSLFYGYEVSKPENIRDRLFIAAQNEEDSQLGLFYLYRAQAIELWIQENSEIKQR